MLSSAVKMFGMCSLNNIINDHQTNCINHVLTTSIGRIKKNNKKTQNKCMFELDCLAYKGRDSFVQCWILLTVLVRFVLTFQQTYRQPLCCRW